MDAFYEELGDGLFRATHHTAGPWDARAQHGGPPAALIGRAVERTGARDDMQVARMTFEILRPVPVSDLRVATRIARPGRNVELVEATMWSDTEPVIEARAWRIRTSSLPLDAPDDTPQVSPADVSAVEPYVTEWGGYMRAMEWRFEDDPSPAAGAARAWMRMRLPLLAGETPSPLARVLAAADSGSGISSLLDWREWLFINTDLAVNLHRLPRGEWVRLDATSTIQPHGIGLAASALWDEVGPIGRGAQTLYIAPRAGGDGAAARLPLT